MVDKDELKPQFNHFYDNETSRTGVACESEPSKQSLLSYSSRASQQKPICFNFRARIATRNK